MRNVIYIIKSTIDDRLYVGSSINFNLRVNQHKHHLRKGTHHSKKLQNFVNKYGIDSIYFEVIHQCEKKEHLIHIEQKYIDELKPFFNINKVADSRLGMKHTEESKIHMVSQRKKKSGYKKGFKRTEQQRLNISKGRKGIRTSHESIMKGVATRRKNGGYKFSKETIEKIRKASTGRLHSEETKKKISESKKGSKNPMYGLKGPDNHRFGKKHTEETKRKMSMRARKVIDTETGIIYKSHKDICDKLNIPKGTMGKYLSGLVKSVNQFKYIEND